MFFNKIYEKIDCGLKEIENLRSLVRTQHNAKVDLICGMDASIGSVKNDLFSLQKEVGTLQKVIIDLKESIAPK